MSLPITKKQFNKSIKPFVLKCKRLPFLLEDDVEIEIKNDDGEIELRPYRAKRYVVEFYKSQDNMIKELFDKKIITYKLVEDITGIELDIVKNIISGKLKKTDNVTRICIENFFNKDYFSKQDKHNEICSKCKNKCKQKYNVILVNCDKRTDKKARKNNQ